KVFNGVAFGGGTMPRTRRSLAPTEPDACHVVEDFKLLTAICGLADCDCRKMGYPQKTHLF
ncbi:MAG: hypothetical protein ACXWRG_19120, partial [Bdellovibrio sp.]